MPLLILPPPFDGHVTPAPSLKEVRQRAETILGINLSEAKAQIKELVEAIIEGKTNPPTPSHAGAGGSGSEEDEEEEEEDEEEPHADAGAAAKKARTGGGAGEEVGGEEGVPPAGAAGPTGPTSTLAGVLAQAAGAYRLYTGSQPTPHHSPLHLTPHACLFLCRWDVLASSPPPPALYLAIGRGPQMLWSAACHKRSCCVPLGIGLLRIQPGVRQGRAPRKSPFGLCGAS